ncbi:MAG: family 10 glycosylhydrolase, partial [Bacteroidales bacterium]
MPRRLLISLMFSLILQQATTQNRQSPQAPLPEPKVFFSQRQAEKLPPKREFRGAWLHTVAQSKYAGMNEREMKQYFVRLLDQLHDAGINTVIFQIRPQADAWYHSSLEPWSEYITGKPGKNPGWDPLAYMVEECHRRNMDIHAWINPYRVKLTASESAFKESFIRKNRKWIVRYGNALWFDPGIPDCRNHIVKVVREIVRNYDIDGLHMDDYFYP